MKVLITGSQGYVGTVVVEFMHQSKISYEIHGLDLGLFQNLNHYYFDNSDIYLNSIQFKDVRDIETADLSNFNAIIHLAAISNDPIGEKFSKITEDINFTTTVELAKKAKAAGVYKFVFASSASVYGFSNNVCFEDSPANPLTVYAKSKLLSEIELEKLSDSNFQVTSLRFSTAAGWSPRIRSDIALNDFIIQAVTKREIFLNSSGEAYRPFIDVKDMAKSIEFSLSELRDSLSSFEIFNVGSDDWNFKIIDLAKIVVENICNSKIIIDEKSNNDTRSYKLNFSKYNSNAGKYKISRNIQETILNMERNIIKISSQENINYFSHVSRLKSIERLIKDKKIDQNLNFL